MLFNRPARGAFASAGQRVSPLAESVALTSTICGCDKQK